MQVIIYKQDNGRLAVVRPTAEALALLGIHVIAQKDVPAGKPYRIIDSSELPADRSQRDLWTVDDVDLTDGSGAAWGAGSDKVVVAWLAGDPNPIPVLRQVIVNGEQQTLGDYSLPAGTTLYSITPEGVVTVNEPEAP